MSWKACAFVKEIRENITQTEKFVLLLLAEYHQPGKCKAWPSVPTLAADSLMTERNLYNVLRSLEKKKFIIRTSQSGLPTEYEICGLTPEKISGVTPEARITPTPENTPENTPEKSGIVIKEEPLEPLEPYNLSPCPKEKSSKKKLLTTFPEGLQPNDSNKALAQSLGINLREFWPSFRDSCLAKDRKYTDWHAAANYWMRNEIKWDKSRVNSNSGQQQLKAGLW